MGIWTFHNNIEGDDNGGGNVYDTFTHSSIKNINTPHQTPAWKTNKNWNFYECEWSLLHIACEAAKIMLSLLMQIPSRELLPSYRCFIIICKFSIYWNCSFHTFTHATQEKKRVKFQNLKFYIWKFNFVAPASISFLILVMRSGFPHGIRLEIENISNSW